MGSVPFIQNSAFSCQVLNGWKKTGTQCYSCLLEIPGTHNFIPVLTSRRTEVVKYIKSKRIKTAAASPIRSGPELIYDYFFILTNSTVVTEEILDGEKDQVILWGLLNDLCSSRFWKVYLNSH